MNLKTFIASLATCALALNAGTGAAAAWAQTPTGPSPVARKIGSIKAINGSQITLTPSSGDEVAVTVQANARILRLEPGQTDVKTAAPIQLQELKLGDTIRVR